MVNTADVLQIPELEVFSSNLTFVFGSEKKMDSAVNNAENQAIAGEETTEEVPPESFDKNAEETGNNSEDTGGSAAEITNVEEPIQGVEDINIKMDKDDDVTDDTEEDKKDDIVEDSEIKEEEKQPEETSDQARAVELTVEGKKDDMTSTKSDEETRTEAESKLEVKDEWLDILGSGLLKKKVSVGFIYKRKAKTKLCFGFCPLVQYHCVSVCF